MNTPSRPPVLRRLDARLGGGFPRGQMSEVVGARSSGRTSLLLQMLAAATARGELVALVDVLDMLDVASADAAGIDLERLLWIRGQVVPNPGLCRDLNQRALERADQALTLVLQAGNFGLRRASMRPRRRPTRSGGCRSRRGCGCSASSKAARPPACSSAASRWRAARRG